MEQMLVERPASMQACLVRLCTTNDALMFWNADRSLRLMIRSDGGADCVSEGCMGFDLCIVWDDSDKDTERLLDLEHDGYLEEPGVFVLDQFGNVPLTFQEDSPGLKRVIEAVNRAHWFRPCPCRRYLIKDEADLCAFCSMTADEAGLAKRFCSICQDDGLAMHMTQQACCGQGLHQACAKTWLKSSSACPMCRA